MSTLRLSGLASGIDTDTIIKDLMNAEKARRVTPLEENKQIDLWQQEGYNEKNKDFANFIIDTRKDLGINSVSTYGYFNASKMDWVKSATSSDESVATVTTSNQALNGTYNVHVTSLAENFAVASTGALGDNDSNISSHFSLVDSDVIKFTITSKDGTTKTFQYYNNPTADDIDPDIETDWMGDLSTTTLSDIVADINSYRDPETKEGLGVQATYDANAKRFFLQTKETGLANGFTIVDDSVIGIDGVKFITGTDNKLKLDWDSMSSYKDIDGNYCGKDGSINFAGANDIPISSNQYTINGISFNFKKENSDLTVQVGTNVDTMVEKITSFIEKYNKIVDSVGETLSEKRYRDFAPLTSDEKDAMTEDEIKLWETKAKSGLLKNDSILTRTMQSLRSGWYASVSETTGSYSQLTEIGITTESYSSSSVGGKLQIDETKLREAIENDVDGVMELLFKEPSSELNNISESQLDSDQLTKKRQGSGLFRRMYDNMSAGMEEIIKKSGTGDDTTLLKNVRGNITLEFAISQGSISTLDKYLSELTDRIEAQEDSLTRIEDRYYAKYTAMEKALSNMNSQSSWLSSMLG